MVDVSTLRTGVNKLLEGSVSLRGKEHIQSDRRHLMKEMGDRDKKATSIKPGSATARRNHLRESENNHAESSTDEEVASVNDDRLADSTDEDEDATGITTFFELEKGPKDPGLHSLTPSNPLYERLKSYRFYRSLHHGTRGERT